MKNIVLIITLFTISIVSHAKQCEASNSEKSSEYKVGDDLHVYYYSTQYKTNLWGNATVVAIRKNSTLVLKVNDTYMEQEQYIAAVNSKDVYNNEECATYNVDFTFTPGDKTLIANYEYIDRVNTLIPIQAEVVATNDDQNSIILLYEHNKKVLKSKYPMHSTVYKKNHCSFLSENGEEICDTDIVLDLASAKEVEVLALSYTQAIVKEIHSEKVYIQNTKNLIQFLQED